MLYKFFLWLLILPVSYCTPNMNSGAGCSGSGCHTSQAGIVSVTLLNNLQIKISVSGTSSKVAGEIVNSSGSVVAVINSTSTNPFTLTAPSAGTYKVNAGYKNPSRRWDSTSVAIGVTDMNDDLIEHAPRTYKLFGNYPNPFNPSTKIIWQSPVSGWQSLKVFDVLGDEVATLVDEYKPAGKYEIYFDAKNLPSGVYFYKLVAKDFVSVKKMMLVK
jgi:hypothetical protein